MTKFGIETGVDQSLILGPHQARLDELQQRWDRTLPEVASLFGLSEHEATPLHLQERSFQAWMSEREKSPDSPIIIGVAGPGASGKGTITEYLERNLDYPKVINTTTRQPRTHETHGQHYYFLSPEEFRTRLSAGDFLTVTERPNRGAYAISKAEVEEKLAIHRQGCVIEENPQTLLSTLSSTGREQTNHKLTTLLYVLPPDPIMETLAKRLHTRSSPNPLDRRLASEDVESTLGDRQIDEFATLAMATRYPGVNVLFLVNDNLEQTYQKLDILFGKQTEAANE